MSIMGTISFKREVVQLGDSLIFYAYSIIMSVIGLGFYFYGLLNSQNSLKVFMKFAFSTSVAWVLSAAFLGGIQALSSYTNLQFNWFLFLVVYLLPFISFIGFQLMLYELLQE